MRQPIHDYYGAGTPTMTEVRCDRCGADAEHEIEGEDLCVRCAELVAAAWCDFCSESEAVTERMVSPSQSKPACQACADRYDNSETHR